MLGPEKATKIGPKMAPKKVAKTVTSIVTCFFSINLTKIMYFTKENGLRGPILLYFIRNSCVRKGRKIQANVAKTLGKQWFLYFFCVSLENAFWRFWAFKGPNLGPKKWFGSDENRKLKKRLGRRRLGNLHLPKNGSIPPLSARGQTSWEGGRGEG